VIDDSRVRCWGQNNFGQVGADRPEATVLAPTLVTRMDGEPLDDVASLHGGNAQFCAFTADAAVWCWGYGYERYAAAYGITNIVALGGTEAGPRYLTSDGVYHVGNAAVDPSCGELP
jgi:alpha-tubulin suppressor-like RCC1 family protein